MSTVLNDRDAILQAAGTRIVNPKNADILLDMSAPAFHVDASGVADVASITITGTLVGLEGALSWSVQGATLSNVTDRSATVTYASMQGATAIVTASMTSSGELFSRGRVLATMQDGAPGTSAKTAKLTPSEQVFKISKAGTNSPASITLTATGQNTAGVPSFTIPAGTATLTAGANASQKVLTFANMATDAVTVEVTLDGQKDRVTIYKVREGQDGLPGQPGVDATVGLLTNESVTLPAGSNGVVSSFSSAVCTLVMYKGASDDSANWTYAFAPASASNRLSYTTSGSTVTLTGMAAGVDSSYVDITASKAGASSVTKRFFVSKSKAGASVTGARGAGQYYVIGSAWSDVVAQAACPGGPVVNDQVTISNGAVTYTKRWDGSVWYVPGAYLSGDLFVDGDINGSKLKVGTVQVTTPAGVPVVTIGGLQAGFEAPNTKNADLAPAISAAAATAAWDGIADIPYQSILNNDDSVVMGFNPTFSDWPAGVSRPVGWAGQVPTKDTVNKRLGAWAVKFTTTGAAQFAINKKVAVPTLPLGTFIAGTYDIYIATINAGNTTGKPGLMVRLWYNATQYVDRPFAADLLAGQWQRINFTARLNAGQQIVAVEFYLFGAYAGGGFGGALFNGVVSFDSFRFALYDNSLDNTAITLAADGTLTGAAGGTQKVTITGLGYTGALNATNGAPAGTSVGGTEAGLLASRALNGDTALNAVNNATTGLAAKLSAAGNQNLVGPIALTANGAIVVGDTNTGVVVNTGGITLRKGGKNRVVMNNNGDFGLYADDGSLILGAESSLAQQTSSNPNLVPNCRGWTDLAGVTSNRNGDPRFGDGQYLYFNTGGNGSYTGAHSPALGIPANSYYTVSFDAYCESGSRYVNCDVYNGSTIDSGGAGWDIGSGMRRYSFTEQMPNIPATDRAWLRIFTGAGGPVVVSNIKVELGMKVTPWNDSIITNDNAKSRVFIQNLQALSAYLGSLEIGPGGAIRQGKAGYGTGNGIWLGDHNGTPKFDIGQTGGAGLVWDGFDLTINRPKLASPFNVVLSDVRITQQVNGSTIQFSPAKSITSGSGNYSYTWSFSTQGVGSFLEMVSSPAGSDVVIKATGSNRWLYGYAALTLKDLASGLTATAYCNITVQFGSGQEP